MIFLNTNLNITNFNICIIGGGDIAYRKLNYLLNFTSNITIISPIIKKKMLKTIKKYNLKVKYRRYKKKDIKKYNIIVVTANSLKIQKQIYKQTNKLTNTFCNCVDSKEYSNIIFPSLIKTKHLTISISTDGISPAFSKQFRQYLENFIPKDIDKFLNDLSIIRQKLPKGKKRMEILNKKVEDYLLNI
jgi:precorrin-2 dehydrogenase/sirohydrochlorin ferrochelatase